MQSSNDLQHSGVLGMKWGIRRYQNKDGTLTEEGKQRYAKKYPYQDAETGSLNERGQRDFMKAAKKGKLDYKRLSDKELDMINNRFNKEKQFQRNVEEFEKSTFKYKVKEAAISRLKGTVSGGGGGGGKKGGKSGGGIKSLLLTPITKAFTDAFNYQPPKSSGGGNKKGENESNDESSETASLYAKKGKSFFADHVNLGSLVSKYSQSNSENGRRFMSQYLSDTSRPDDRVRWVGSSEEALRSRYQTNHATEDWSTRTTRNAWENTSNKRKKKAKHSDDDGIMFVITRGSANELTHHGIKGQKWGVRRFQNEDRTLTPAGKERYGKGDSDDKQESSEDKSRSYSGGAKQANREFDELEKMPADKRKQKLQSYLDEQSDWIKEIHRKSASDKPYERDEKDDYMDTAYSKIFDMIRNKSGDWYENKPVSEANKQISKEIDEAKQALAVEYAIATGKYYWGGPIDDKVIKKRPIIGEIKKNYNQLMNDRLGVVLTDIGLDDTPENRTKIEPYYYWD